jgi:predicted NBD/HSP70 family sugar kinase
LQQQFPSTPIYVDNEANMAALGEHFFGAAQGFNNILYLSIGVGLGGALVQDGQIQRGSTGFAGEFGHMTVDPAGELCACGNRGCWETLVGQFALFRLVKQQIPTSSASPLAHDQDHLSLTRIIEAVQAGDSAAHAITITIGQRLGMGIASLVNVVNPDLVLIGGLVSILSDLLIPAIAAEVNRRSVKWSAHATKHAAAHYGFDACVMGGVAVVYQTILTQPASA